MMFKLFIFLVVKAICVNKLMSYSSDDCQVSITRTNLNVRFADMEFVHNFTPPDFQAKNFTPSISPNFNSFSKKKHKK